MRLSDLKERSVKSITIKGTTYFYVEDIKENYKDLKIDAKEIVYQDNIPLIKARYIEQKTEFDLMMEKTLNKDKNQ